MNLQKEILAMHRISRTVMLILQNEICVRALIRDNYPELYSPPVPLLIICEHIGGNLLPVKPYLKYNCNIGNNHNPVGAEQLVAFI